MSFKLHWLCHSPSPYNDYLFRSLTGDSEIDLLVHFRKKASSPRPWKEPTAQGFPNRCYRETFDIDKKLLNLAAKDKNSLFVLGGWDHFTAWVVLTILMIRKKPFVIWTDTPNIHKTRTWIKDKLRLNWLKLIFHSAVAVMGTGEPAIKILEKMGCPKEKIINFPYWTPLPTDWNNNKRSFDKIIFFSIGRLYPNKAYDLAINALEKVFREYQNKKVEYWIFGDGPEQYNLETLAKQTGIMKIVKFWGWREPKSIQKQIKRADVFVHPALWEPYGVAVLEAMAGGKPILGSDKTMAVLDRVEHNVNGFIHKAGDIGQLADQMIFLIQNPDEIKVMGRKARQTAEKWPVERGLKIIREIVQKLNK